ncbi:MAG: DUF2621 family protein [Chloroflexota bacterium]|nr:DUF2621 family protein [Chloroflexota bacterium]
MSGPPPEHPDEELPPASMRWEGSADRMLASLVDMVPATLRELARASARDEAEIAANERGADAVEPEDVVRGWIRTTPPEQRDGLVEVIDSLGLDPEAFAADLTSAEGWEETSEE